MKNIAKTTFICAICAFAPLAIACEQPAAISIPDGAKATEEEMLKAGKEFHNYMVDMQKHQACLENKADGERHAAADSNTRATKAREDAYSARHNAASAAMTSTTEKFERAVEAYKAAN